MKVTLHKRYCFKQIPGWRGGLGQALSELAACQAAHPHANVVLEYNERSTSNKYRIVRLHDVTIEMPDMPTEAEYAVPARPRPRPLPKHEVTERIVTDPVSRRRLCISRHEPTGAEYIATLWGDQEVMSPFDRKHARSQLAQKCDSDFSERRNAFLERAHVYDRAVRAWRNECDRLIREADTT